MRETMNAAEVAHAANTWGMGGGFVIATETDDGYELGSEWYAYGSVPPLGRNDRRISTSAALAADEVEAQWEEAC